MSPYNYICKTNTYIYIYNICKYLNIYPYESISWSLQNCFFKPGVWCPSVVFPASPFGLDYQVAYHVYLASDAAGTGRDRLTNETGGRWVKGWGAKAGHIQCWDKIEAIYIVISGQNTKLQLEIVKVKGLWCWFILKCQVLGVRSSGLRCWPLWFAQDRI